MKPPNHLKPPGGRLNLTPIIDIVFLLIIFFIVSNNMIQQDHAVAVDLPEAETGTLPTEQQMRRLTISIPSSGTLYVGAESIEDITKLRQLMLECRANWGETAEIRIRTNKNIPYGEIRPILRMATESGIVRISFVVTERGT